MTSYLGLVAFYGLIAAQFLGAICVREYQREEAHAEAEPSRARKLATSSILTPAATCAT